MSIINSSSRFVLEKMGLSAEWYYLSQQRLTTKYFILLGCYQLGGNFISWKEEQFGRAAAVLISGSVGASTRLCHGCFAHRARDPKHPHNICSHPARGWEQGIPLCVQGQAAGSQSRQSTGRSLMDMVLYGCCFVTVLLEVFRRMGMDHPRTRVSGAEFMAGLGDLRALFQPHQFCDSVGKIHQTDMIRNSLLLYNF